MISIMIIIDDSTMAKVYAYNIFVSVDEIGWNT